MMPASAWSRATRRGSSRAARARSPQSGSSILEAVAALGTAAVLLGGAAGEGARTSKGLVEARALARALTLGRNVLDRALAAPCAPASFAAAACEEPFRCNVAAETLELRAGAQGNVFVVRLRAEVVAGEAGLDERSLVRLTTVGTRPEACG
jgi:hypothetical protein